MWAGNNFIFIPLGNLPGNTGDTSTGFACVPGPFNDCQFNIPIEVKNCGEYNVYHLKETGACPEAYCFGKFYLDWMIIMKYDHQMIMFPFQRPAD